MAHYNLLLHLGGRPTRPLNFELAPWNPDVESREDYDSFHVAGHWLDESETCLPELRRWKKFRKYQRRIREDPEQLPRRQQSVNDYRARHGFDGTVQLLPKLEDQTKLDEWMEYQVWLHHSLAPKERRWKRNQAELAAKEEELQAADSEESRSRIEECVNRYKRMLDDFRTKDELLDWSNHLKWVQQQLEVIASEQNVSPHQPERKSTRTNHR